MFPHEFQKFSSPWKTGKKKTFLRSFFKLAIFFKNTPSTHISTTMNTNYLLSPLPPQFLPPQTNRGTCSLLEGEATLNSPKNNQKTSM